MLLSLQFILCSALIVFSGYKLSVYGDQIAEKTGLGRAWVGLVLMATITSLPELITGISAVSMVGAPNLALGDVMGSCVYNLAILALMDAFNGTRPIFQGVDRGHLLSAGFGTALIAVALLFIMVGSVLPSIGHIGLYTPIIIIVYLVGIRAVYFYEKREIEDYVEEAARESIYRDISFKRAVVFYTINALVIVSAATFLPFIASEIAAVTGLGRTFVGSVFLAMTTSLPEVVVSIAAIRIGAQDMAISNMFGSNMFNILVLAIDDIFYTPGPIFSFISTDHMVTGAIAIAMTAVAVVGITYPPKKKSFLRIGFGSQVLIILWVLNLLLLYLLHNG